MPETIPATSAPDLSTRQAQIEAAASLHTKPTSKDYLVAVFADPDDLMAATRAVREIGQPIHDCYTPFAVHGLDAAQGLGRSWLTYAAFGWACFGLLLALGLQVHSSFIDFDFVAFWKGWPVIVGGKPFISWPAFVPVMFELTILCCGHLTVLTMLIYRGLYPGQRVKLPIDRVTDDRFAVAIDPDGVGYDEAAAREVLDMFGPEELMIIEGSV